MKEKGFNPQEIIFSCTTACNLHCEHCFVNRTPLKLDIDQAVSFLQSCAQGGNIDRVGFTGGEPFLYMDFLLALTKETVAQDLLFDQIMTNGDWWKDQTDLKNTLQSLYDAGYDGKIGLSWDEYHGQSEERMNTFIKTVQDVFGEGSINIQVVSTSGVPEPNGVPEPVEGPPGVQIHTLPRTYPSKDPRAWESKRWFKEDYCQGPGNILYVHADGNIAPCCGFANENPALFIGKITDSYETILKNAGQNKMIQLCFYCGLSSYRRHELKKQLKEQGKKLPGKTSDICSLCDFVCKLN
ncbi:MAG: 4Fe-4S cluster-binding domain-containing protein [Treponema sp.]|nr:4Fe-4S cluster-binding domain-containing protein [Treponema sp.]